MKQEIIDKQVQVMLDRRLDAIVSVSPESFAYVAGFVVPSHSLMRHRHAMAIVNASGQAALLGVDMEESTIRQHVKDVPIDIWAEFTEDPMAVLGKQLADFGLADSLIGIEFDYLPAGDLERLRRALPRARFHPVEKMLACLRQNKTVEEIALLRRLSRIADQAITDTFSIVRAGDTEMDIAGHLIRKVYELGADDFKLLIVASGERSQLPNVGPSGRRLERGDICRVEIFPVIDGYHAGVCRTAVVERAAPEAKRIWQHLVDCKYQIMEMVKPGASCRQIYSAFIDKLDEMGLPPIPFVGHGIGLHLHEAPYLASTPVIGRPDSDVKIEENMVLGFEPLCYRTGYGYGMQNKDMLLVTETGSELLSDYANTDSLIVIE